MPRTASYLHHYQYDDDVSAWAVADADIASSLVSLVAECGHLSAAIQSVVQWYTTACRLPVGQCVSVADHSVCRYQDRTSSSPSVAG